MSTAVNDAYRPPSAPPPRAAASTGLYAGFWRRGAAYLIDGLILFIPCLIVGLLPILGFFLQIVIWATYKALLESGEGQATLGKRALGIKVTTLDGERISVGQALGRYFGSFLSGLILGIGYFMAGVTARKQALHDMMASTLVVKADASEEEITGGAGTMPMTIGVWITVILFFIFPFGGIFAAISIPAYQDYVGRSKMTEVILETSRVQSDAAEEIAKARSGTPVAAHDVPTQARFVKRLAIDPAAGTIRAYVDTARLGIYGIHDGAAFVRTMNPEGSAWACGADGIPPRYLPASCRH